MPFSILRRYLPWNGGTSTLYEQHASAEFCAEDDVLVGK
jgi:hypothetical protein